MGFENIVDIVFAKAAPKEVDKVAAAAATRATRDQTRSQQRRAEMNAADGSLAQEVTPAASESEGGPGILARAAGVVFYPIGVAFDVATAAEQALSAKVEAPINELLTAMGIPLPVGPSLRVFDLCLGMPHGHVHPPNLIPPAPMLMLPGFGVVLPIPYLSGASQTLVDGKKAARCGDFALTPTCGGLFPFGEIFFGSSSVWIEGARNARMMIDFSKHCIFSGSMMTKVPGMDPSVGPPMGLTMPSGNFSVITGGIPMPSLTNFLMGKAFQKIFAQFGKVGRFIARNTRTGKVVAAAVERRSAAMAKRLANAAHFLDDVTRPVRKAFTRDIRDLLKKRANRRALTELVDRKAQVAPARGSRAKFEGPEPKLAPPDPEAVRAARIKMRDGLPMTPADTKAILDQAVHGARESFLREGSSSPFTPKNMQGMCGRGQGLVAEQLEGLGVPKEKIFNHQAATVFPGAYEGAGRHAFTVVEMPDGSTHLVDTTYRQFYDFDGRRPLQSGWSGRQVREMGFGDTADALLRDGHVPLTDDFANAYGQSLDGGRLEPFSAKDISSGSSADLDYTSLASDVKVEPL